MCSDYYRRGGKLSLGLKPRPNKSTRPIQYSRTRFRYDTRAHQIPYWTIRLQSKNGFYSRKRCILLGRVQIFTYKSRVRDKGRCCHGIVAKHRTCLSDQTVLEIINFRRRLYASRSVFFLLYNKRTNNIVY